VFHIFCKLGSLNRNIPQKQNNVKMIRRIFPILLLQAITIVTASQEYHYNTFTYLADDTTVLELDYFRPDSLTGGAPLVIFLHGGGFSGGVRSDGHPFCQALSDSGIHAASISYTLYMKGKNFSCDGILSEKVKAIQLAASQSQMAVNWFLDKADLFGIDSTKIFLAGSSAGAEAVLQSVYQDPSGEQYYPESLPPGFRFAGVISGAGALLDINMIDRDNMVPTLSFHGTCDPLVPYHIAPHHYCNQIAPGYMMMFGSLAIHERLTELNGSTHLMSYCGDGHKHAGTPFYGPEIQTVTAFIHRTVQGEKFNIHRIFKNSEPCELGIDFVFCF
jgi:acetyl esterase/lipase